MTTYIYSYNPYSASAKALSEALGIKRIKHRNSRYRPKREDVIINWGSSRFKFNQELCNVINKPHFVGLSTNKLGFFVDQENGGNNNIIVPWTQDRVVVAQWLEEGHAVVARTSLTGHSGEGIILIDGINAPIPEAPLYTLYKAKTAEYRVHCYRNGDNVEVFDVQQKKRDRSVLDHQVNWKVRNLAGGFIYARNDIVVPESVTEAAKAVFDVTNLDFGAVDIIFNEKSGSAYVLEINTAPGLTGTTLDKYVEMIGRLIE